MNNRDTNLGYFFSGAAARFADKVAVIDLYGGVERFVTYSQLDEHADRVAGLLTKLGVAPGERVGMIVGNRVEFLEIFFGSMRAGAIPVAINTRLARDTLRFILEDAECRVAFVEPAAHSSAIVVAQAASLAHRVALENPPAGWIAYAAARD
ncbi:MAG TPA: AMP-binding protein, partial [Burkholderiales bacterium]|nr:AMP-binding protein [Burkholderiales bacterium]